MKRRLFFAIIFFISLVALYYVSGRLSIFYTILLTEALLFGILAMSLDLIMGYADLVSFGHAAFFGTGAFVSGLLILHFELSLLFVIPIAIAVNALLGFVIGGLSIRAKGIYFAMLTLAFCEVLKRLIYDWRSVTGGSDGIAGISPTPLNFGFFKIDIFYPPAYLCFTVILAGAAFLICHLLVRSSFGSVLKAIGDNEERTRFIGYDVKKYKLIAFIISASIGGLSGALYSPLAGFASYDLLDFHVSGKVILMCLMGGLGTITGPFLGGIFLTLLESFLSSLIEGYHIIIGLVFIFIVIFLPKGLISIVGLPGKNIMDFIKKTLLWTKLRS